MQSFNDLIESIEDVAMAIAGCAALLGFVILISYTAVWLS